MRLTVGCGLTLGLCLFPAVASALVYEPNNVQDPPSGLLVPIASSGEEQLSTLFSDRGEAIDWHNDAHITPNAFAPICGFTATFVLNQASNHYGIAWYNDEGHVPAAADLHVLVAAGSAVGTTFAGTDIRSDAAYTGGLVGFALVGGETHYTNSAYGTVCTATTVCNPAAPWITALIYASTATKDAYYLAFEDGATASNGWNNDGDFNDDVFFLTGISTNATSNGCGGTTPVCNVTCVACDGDFDSGAANSCQAGGAPQCSASGACTAIADAGAGDADAAATDGSVGDGGEDDAQGSSDGASATDAGIVDSGTTITDATIADAATEDAGSPPIDATVADAGSTLDAMTGIGPADTGVEALADAESGASGLAPAQSSGCGCRTAGGGSGGGPTWVLGALALAAAAVRRRKRAYSVA